MKTRTLIKTGGALVLATLALSAFGYSRALLAKDFDFKDGKGANGFSFAMTRGLEPIHGFGNDVSGSLNLNLEKPELSRGTVIIGTNSIRLTSDAMTKNMTGEWCLDTAKYPTASFTVVSAKVKKRNKDVIAGSVTGDFKIKDVTKRITVPVTAKIADGGVKVRYGDAKLMGDVVTISTSFTFNRFDYGIGNSLDKALLSNEVDVQLNIAGTAFSK